MAVLADLTYRKLFFTCSLGASLTTACLTPQFDFGDTPFADSDPLNQSDINNGEGGSLSGETANVELDKDEDEDTNPVVIDEGDEPELPAHCSDRKLNDNETGIDCGGASCEACAEGQSCIINADCAETPCTGNLCLEPSCTDGIKNQGETDKDCGGPACSQCTADQACAQDSDCESGACSSSMCQEPRCDDQRKNGRETDIDCGGDECSPCEFGQECNDEPDCTDLSADPKATARCSDNICAIECSAGFADCDGDNSCSYDIQSSVRCGGCLAEDLNIGEGVACAEKTGATAACSDSVCTWSCRGGFLDNDNDLQTPSSNGCEDQLPSCFTNYKFPNNYVIGSQVSRSQKNWRCSNGNCSTFECKPGVSCGFGQTWTNLGSCF